MSKHVEPDYVYPLEVDRVCSRCGDSDKGAISAARAVRDQKWGGNPQYLSQNDKLDGVLLYKISKDEVALFCRKCSQQVELYRTPSVPTSQTLGPSARSDSISGTPACAPVTSRFRSSRCERFEEPVTIAVSRVDLLRHLYRR
jgi:hypothetical protein